MINFSFPNLEAYTSFLKAISQGSDIARTNEILCDACGIERIVLSTDENKLLQDESKLKVRELMRYVYDHGGRTGVNRVQDPRVSQLAADYLLELLELRDFSLEINTERSLCAFLDFTEMGHGFLYLPENISDLTCGQVARKLVQFCEETTFTRHNTSARVFAVLTNMSAGSFKICRSTDYEMNSGRVFDSNFTNQVLKPLVIQYANEACRFLGGSGIRDRSKYF